MGRQRKHREGALTMDLIVTIAELLSGNQGYLQGGGTGSRRLWRFGPGAALNGRFAPMLG